MRKEIKRFFKENYKLIIVTFLIGLLAHGFAVTNKLIGYDELSYVFDKGVSLPSARWGIELVRFIFPDISMPWYNGIIALIILSISIALVVDILGIKNKYFKLLICGTLITFPSITSTYIYMFTVTTYSISIFLSIVSVVLLRSKKTIFNVLSILTMVLSLSIYQSYICITMTMLVMLVIKDCINEKISIKKIMQNCLKYIIYIIVSLFAYLDIAIVVNNILNVSISGYKGLNSMGIVTISDIVNGIFTSYKNIYEMFPESSLGDTFGFNTFIKIFIFIALLLTVILTIIKIIQLIRKKEIARTILLLLLLIIQPIAINFIIVINPKIDGVYSIMIYQYVFFIITPLILYEWFGFKKIKCILYVVFIIIIFQFITISNKCYFRAYLIYENIYSFSSDVINRVLETDGYDKSTPVAFVGIYNGELNTQYYDYFREVQKMGGNIVNSSDVKPDMWALFIKNFIGIDFKYMYTDDVSDDFEYICMTERNKNKIKDIMKTAEFKKMNVYPYSNSIRKIDGIIIVKFSEK